MSGTRPQSDRSTLVLGSILGLLAVGLGAFGAHGLEGRLEGAPDGGQRLEWWGTAAHYHLVHAAVVTAVGLGVVRARGAALALALGIAVFSGTLYAMALGAPSKLGMVTPVGGLLLMVGWALLAVAAARRSPDQ